MVVEASSTFVTPTTQETATATKSVSDLKLLSYARPQPYSELDIA
ncbi:hypothetical protein Tco_0521485, partial [Tanacetum coccineum]